MTQSNLDNLPDKVQQSIYTVFKTMSIRDKIIFLSKLEYSNHLTYREISEVTGITFQRVQQLYDTYIDEISTLSKSNDIIVSGVII